MAKAGGIFVRSASIRAAACAALIAAVGVGCATSRGSARGSGDSAAPARDDKAPANRTAQPPRETTAGSASAKAASAPGSARVSPASAPATYARCGPGYTGPVDSYVTILDFGIPKVLQYPAKALAKDISGMVKVRTLIGTDGSVCEAEIVEGPPLLHEAAIQAARETRIRPAMKDGRAVPMWVVIPFVFTLPAKTAAAPQSARR